MIAVTERILDRRPNALGNGRLQEGGETAEQRSIQDVPGGEQSRTEAVQSIRDELDSVRSEQAKLQQAVYEAAQIQRRLCAPRELVCGEFEIAGEIFPVRHLSGDLFKVMQLESGLALAVGDIAGKGLSAGIWQAYLMALIQRCARRHSDPAEAVAEVNRELCQDRDEPPMAALLFARIDLQSNELVYCNAGLPAPLLLRREGTVEQLDKGGPMLGAMEEGAFNSGVVLLNPGDMLVAYTDGVTECQNAHEEEFEIKRLAAAASVARHGSANQALFSTLATVLDFADGCSPGDDLTLLVVRRRETAIPAEMPAQDKRFPAARRGPGSLVRRKKTRKGKIPNH